MVKFLFSDISHLYYCDKQENNSRKKNIRDQRLLIRILLY